MIVLIILFLLFAGVVALGIANMREDFSRRNIYATDSDDEIEDEIEDDFYCGAQTVSNQRCDRQCGICKERN